MGKSRKRQKINSADLNGSISADLFITCEPCLKKIPNNPTSINLHFKALRHIKKEKLFILHSHFLRYGLDYAIDGKSYYCESCDLTLQLDADELLNHITKRHQILKEVVFSNFELFPRISNTLEVCKSKIYITDFSKSKVELNKELNSYKFIERPIRLVEEGPGKDFICEIRNNIFTEEELISLTKVASFLERNGNYVSRSDAKGSSNICAFGMRWARGDTGWYKHKNQDCYRLSEECASLVNTRLKAFYPCVFEHLEKVRLDEGFICGEACIGDSVFTSFAITRDYNCQPHVDQDDYDFGFIIWVQEEAIIEGSNAPGLFSFPEVKVSFYPGHGDVLCFRAKSIFHCTRHLEKKNQLGFAFFQKTSLYRQLGKLLQEGQTEFYDKKKKEKIIEKKEDFKQKEALYRQQRFGGRLSISML